MEENALEYMGFLLSTFSPENEEFVTEYLYEIESQEKNNGYWSCKAAYDHPLALVNYANCSVIIYTSKQVQRQIIVTPTLTAKEQNNELK